MSGAGPAAISAISNGSVEPLSMRLAMPGNPTGQIRPSTDLPASAFGSMLMQNLQRIDGKIGQANSMVRQFAVDDSIPVHQVTIALEEAQMSVELAMQVRAQMVEGYRQLMNMQL